MRRGSSYRFVDAMSLAESRFQTRKIRESNIARSRVDERRDRGIRNSKFDQRMLKGLREEVERYRRREGRVVELKEAEERIHRPESIPCLVSPLLSLWALPPALLVLLAIG